MGSLVDSVTESLLETSKGYGISPSRVRTYCEPLKELRSVQDTCHRFSMDNDDWPSAIITLLECVTTHSAPGLDGQSMSFLRILLGLDGGHASRDQRIEQFVALHPAAFGQKKAALRGAISLVEKLALHLGRLDAYPCDGWTPTADRATYELASRGSNAARLLAAHIDYHLDAIDADLVKVLEELVRRHLPTVAFDGSLTMALDNWHQLVEKIFLPRYLEVLELYAMDEDFDEDEDSTRSPELSSVDEVRDFLAGRVESTITFDSLVLTIELMATGRPLSSESFAYVSMHEALRNALEWVEHFPLTSGGASRAQ